MNLVVPTIDTELATLSEARAQFEDQGVEIAVSSPRVVALAGNKEQTAQVLARAGLPTPRTLSAGDFLARPTELDEPLILKPRAGSSSIGLVRPRDVEEARRIARESPELIVQERWSGREYTVNLYFDGRGALRCAVPHWRIETRQGEVSKGQTEDVPSLRAAARKLAACLEGARAALCFQAIVREDGSYAIFEINARFGGGYPLAHRAGARFAQWLLEESLGRECTAADDWSAGVTMLRYDAAVFLE